jgi:hypothetical protein
MKHHLFSLIAAVAVATATASCSCDLKPADADCARAVEQGRSDAVAFCRDTLLADRDVIGMVLSVRAREGEMRRQGLDAAADAYINAFQDYVTVNNPTLASQIFDAQ